MNRTTESEWHATGFLKHSEEGYEVAVVADKPADLFDCMPLSRQSETVAWVRVVRPARGPANIDHLRRTAQLVAAAPAMRHALAMALHSGLLDRDQAAQDAARQALAAVKV